MVSYLNIDEKYGSLRRELVSHYFGNLASTELTALVTHLRQMHAFSERVLRHLQEFESVLAALESRHLVTAFDLTVLEKLAETSGRQNAKQRIISYRETLREQHCALSAATSVTSSLAKNVCQRPPKLRKFPLPARVKTLLQNNLRSDKTCRKIARCLIEADLFDEGECLGEVNIGEVIARLETHSDNKVLLLKTLSRNKEHQLAEQVEKFWTVFDVQ